MRPDPAQDPSELLESMRWTRRLARRLVHDPALAADIHQDTWTRALERFGKALPGRAWLAGTLRSLAFRERRGERRRRRREAEGARREEVPSTDELIERNEAQQRVAAAVLRLPAAQREVLLLHFQEGLSLAAIARRLGCSKSTAGEHVQRGLVALRRELREDAEGWHGCCLLTLPLGADLAGLPPSALASPAPAVPAGALASTTLTGVAMKKTVLAVAVLAVLALTIRATREAFPIEPGVTSSSDEPSVGLADVTEPDEPVASLDSVLVDAPSREVRQAVEPKVSPEDVYLVRARVVDAEGVAVPKPRLRASRRDVDFQAVGDDDGRVELALRAGEIDELAARSFSLEIAADPYLSLWTRYVRVDGTGTIAPPRIGATQDFGTVTLEPAGAIEGQALSTTGVPIAGARIDVHDYDAEDPEAHYAYRGSAPEVVTDEGGRFVVPHLLAGPTAFSVTHSDFLRKSPLTVVDVVPGTTSGPVLLRATPAMIVTGRVVDPDGDPVEGAYVNGTENWSITDTDETDEDGRFRIGLRKGGPAAVEVHLPGWRRVSPERGTLHDAGEIEIVVERILPDAAYRVRIVDGDSGERLRSVGVSVLAAGSAEPGAHDTDLTERVVQPLDGLPLDYAPGEDLLHVSADGYESVVVATESHATAAPHLTVELFQTGGVRGRLLRDGRPLAGARVQITGTSAYLPRPREHLVSGRTVRCEAVPVDARALTGFGGYSPVSVLGLDGPPPSYRLVTMSKKHGTLTDEDGSFRFRGVDEPSVGLVLPLDGGGERVLGTYTLENGALDVGEIEVGETATLRGRFESSWSFEPLEHAIKLSDPERHVTLDANGGFVLEGLQPGSVYFSFGPAGQGLIFDELQLFEDVPTFHVDLAPGETRDVVIRLDAYAPSWIELDVTIGGRVPLANCSLTLQPVDESERTFGFSCAVEGHRITASGRALGLCHLTFSQASDAGGYTRFELPGGPIDLRPGETARRSVDIPAGHVSLTLPPAHVAREHEQFDLILDGEDRTVEVLGIGPVKVDSHLDPLVLRPMAIPAGSYTARLRPWRRAQKGEVGDVLARFDVVVRSGATTDVAIEH